MKQTQFCINVIADHEVNHLAVIQATNLVHFNYKLNEALENHFDCVVLIKEEINEAFIDKLVKDIGIHIVVDVCVTSKDEKGEDFTAEIEILPTYIY